MKLIILTALMSCLWLVACTNKENKIAQSEHEEEHSDEVVLTPEQFKTANIQTQLISSKALSGTVKVNGLLDLPPQSKVSISSPFAGILKSTNMLPGKKVYKGEVLAVLEHPDYLEIQQNYLELKNQLSYVKADFERQQELAKQEVNAKKTLQKADTDYQILLAKFNAAKSKLRLMNINFNNLDKGLLSNTITLYAPITGFVTEVQSNIGAMINPSDVIMKVADTEHLHAELTVYEKDLPLLKIGQKVRFILANEDKERKATIYLIGREISNERTLSVHCHLDKEDGQLIPGMYLQAFIESVSETVNALPDEAIVEFEGEKYVFIEEDAKAYQYKMIKVNTGVKEFGYTQISSDELKDLKGVKFVTDGAYDLLSQLKNTEEEEGGH